MYVNYISIFNIIIQIFAGWIVIMANALMVVSVNARTAMEENYVILKVSKLVRTHTGFELHNDEISLCI